MPDVPGPPPPPLHSAAVVAERIEEALLAHRSLALVRLGDGEALTLAHDLLFPVGEARERGPFLGYAGVSLPDHTFRDILAAAVRLADIVGVTTADAEPFWPLLSRALAAHRLDLSQKLVTDATINYALYTEGHLARLLLDLSPPPRTLVVGNLAAPLAAALQGQGADIVGQISPVAGHRDIPRVLALTRGFSFDLALIAAGIPAVVMAVAMARTLGQVAIDFGHLADGFRDGLPLRPPPPE